MRRIAVVAVVALMLSSCAGIHKRDQQLYDMGFENGQGLVMEPLGDKEKAEVCISVADFTAEEAGWNEDQRFDFLMGCREGAEVQ